MNRTDIITRLKALPYSTDDYWVITGGAMVLYGIREETHDIDLGCSPEMADRLEAEGFLYQVNPNGNRWFKIDPELEVFENWLYDTVSLLDGIPVISIPGLILMKQSLGRDKDLRDLELIREYTDHEQTCARGRGYQHP